MMIFINNLKYKFKYIPSVITDLLEVFFIYYGDIRKKIKFMFLG